MKNMTLLAVGGAGCRIMREIVARQSSGFNLHLLAADTDAQSLAESTLPPENQLLLGELWRHGQGCGGNAINGQRAFGSERARLSEVLRDSSFVLVVAGLGGGCASGGLPVIQSVLHKLKIPVLFLVALPFVMEGHSRRQLAEKTIEEDLSNTSGVVVPLPNDLLFSTLSADTPLATAFKLADEQVAGAVLALTVLLSSGNLLSADFATLGALLARRGDCGIGFGAADKTDSQWLKNLVDQLLDSPLLGGSEHLQQADAVIVALNSPDLSLGEAKLVFETLQNFWGEKVQVLSGAGNIADWGDKLQLTVVTVKFRDFELAAEKVTKPTAAAAHEDGIQQDLPFDNASLSTGIMENTTPVFFGKENLDVPTFIRRHLSIDCGG